MKTFGINYSIHISVVYAKQRHLFSTYFNKEKKKENEKYLCYFKR